MSIVFARSLLRFGPCNGTAGWLLVLGLAALARLDAPSPTYVETITTAEAKLADGDTRAARELLLEASSTERGFEWAHLGLRVALAPKKDGKGGQIVSTTDACTQLFAHPGAVNCVAFDRTGERLATCGEDSTLRLWNARTCAVEHKLEGHSASVTACAFSPDGTLLASTASDGSLRIWEVASGKSASGIQKDGTSLRALAWSPDSTLVAAGTSDAHLYVWNAASGAQVCAASGHTGALTAVLFADAGRTLWSAAEDGTLRSWNAQDGAALQVLRDRAGTLACAGFDASSKRLVCASLDGGASVWNTASGALERKLEELRATCLAFSADGTRLAFGARNRSVRVVDPVSGATMLTLGGATDALTSVAWSADGARLACTARDGTLRIYETDRAVAQRAQEVEDADLPGATQLETLRPGEIDACCWKVLERANPDPRVLARAEHLARSVSRSAPKNGALMTTLGAVQVRRKHFREALETLTLANQKKRGLPLNLGYRALAHLGLKQPEEARALLVKLRKLMAERRWNDDGRARDLLNEVERRLEGAAR